MWTLASSSVPTINFITILFIPIVKYTVKVYTPDALARTDYELTVRIKGQGKQKTADHVLYETTQDTEKYDKFFLCFSMFRVRGGHVTVTGMLVIPFLG